MSPLGSAGPAAAPSQGRPIRRRRAYPARDARITDPWRQPAAARSAARIASTGRGHTGELLELADRLGQQQIQPGDDPQAGARRRPASGVGHGS